MPRKADLEAVRAQAAALLTASTHAATDIELVRATHEALASLRGPVDAVRAVASCRAAMASHLAIAREEARAAVAAAREAAARVAADAAAARTRSEYADAVAAAAQDVSDALRRQFNTVGPNPSVMSAAAAAGGELPATPILSSSGRAASASAVRPLRSSAAAAAAAPSAGSPALWIARDAPGARGALLPSGRGAALHMRTVAPGSHDDSFRAFARHEPRGPPVGAAPVGVAGPGAAAAAAASARGRMQQRGAAEGSASSPTRFSPVEPNTVAEPDPVRFVAVTLPAVSRAEAASKAFPPSPARRPRVQRVADDSTEHDAWRSSITTAAVEATPGLALGPLPTAL